MAISKSANPLMRAQKHTQVKCAYRLFESKKNNNNVGHAKGRGALAKGLLNITHRESPRTVFDVNSQLRNGYRRTKKESVLKRPVTRLPNCIYSLTQIGRRRGN